jgi:hypothetical protein
MAPYEFYDYSYMEPAIGSAAGSAAAGVLGFFAVFFGIFYLIMLAFSVAKYVLHALGLYVVAKRRGIRNPWLSWIPIAEAWILGSLSDQYQYVKKGKIRNRRKVLLGLEIGTVVSLLVILGSIISMAGSEFYAGAGDMLLGASLATLLLGYFALFIVAVVAAVFLYIAYYDYFVSCEPNNAVLYLVLSILIPVTLPFFIFFSRKKDLGMPPKKQPQPPVIETVAAEPMACEPAEPAAEVTEPVEEEPAAESVEPEPAELPQEAENNE